MQNCKPARNFHSNYSFLKGTHYMEASYLAKLVEMGAPKYKVNIVQTSHFPNFFLMETLVYIYLRT